MTGLGDLDVHPPGLHTAGDRLQAATERWDAARRRHTTGVAGRGDLCGGDPVGSFIGASYQAALEIAETSFTSVTESFTGFATALHTMADEFSRTDDHAAEAMNRAAELNSG